MFFEDRKQVVCVRHTGGVATLVLGEEGGLGIKGKQNGRRMLHGIHDECLKVIENEDDEFGVSPVCFNRCLAEDHYVPGPGQGLKRSQRRMDTAL